MPSAQNFTKCFISGTRQRMSLTSAQTRTLDKDTTLGKAALCRVLRVDTRQRRPLCRVLRGNTRQRLSLPSVNVSHSANFGPPLNQPAAVSSLPSVQRQHSAKYNFFWLLHFKIFHLSTHHMWYSMLKFGVFLNLFAIFN